jgi:NADH-quinone oxidoreductase subunit M
MHNPVGPNVMSREISLHDGLVLVPLIAVVVFFAVYPQLALHRQERSVTATIAPARALTEPPLQAEAHR